MGARSLTLRARALHPAAPAAALVLAVPDSLAVSAAAADLHTAPPFPAVWHYAPAYTAATALFPAAAAAPARTAATALFPAAAAAAPACTAATALFPAAAAAAAVAAPARTAATALFPAAPPACTAAAAVAAAAAVPSARTPPPPPPPPPPPERAAALQQQHVALAPAARTWSPRGSGRGERAVELTCLLPVCRSAGLLEQ